MNKIYSKVLKKINEPNQEIDQKKGDDLLKIIKHINIIKYYGYFWDDDRYLYFILELYQVNSKKKFELVKGLETDLTYYVIIKKRGTLEETLTKLKENNFKLEEDKVLQWSKELLDAVNYLSTQNICHNDLKPS